MAFPQRTAMGIFLLAALAVSAPAHAQTLSLDDNQEGVVRGPLHDSVLLANNEINKADCVNDEVINFNIGVVGAIDQTYNFEVWKGTDCANMKTRFEDTSNCVEIEGSYFREEQSINAAVSVRIMLSTKKGGSSSGGTGGTSGTGGTDSAGSAGSGAAGTGGAGTGGGGTGGTGGSAGSGATGGTAGAGGAETSSSSGVEACEGDRSFSTPQDLTLHFILSDGNGEQPSANYTAASWSAKYDLVGPGAPRGVTAGIGENTLILGWTIEDSRGDIDHYNAYCSPPPGTTVMRPDDCTSELTPNEEPDPAYFCGESEGYSASMQTASLENGVTYEVAVAGVDNFYNIGLLSSSTCQAPQLVTDFYEAYRQAGGEGGGGFCAIGAGRSTGFAAFLALGALGWAARRRATRSRRGAR